jgi:hypothetical protein
MVVFGGVSQNPQIKKLRKWVEIVIATPWRLLDLINQKHVNLSKVEIFTLDEADRMLDMGFIHDIKKIHKTSWHHLRVRLFLFFRYDAHMHQALGAHQNWSHENKEWFVWKRIEKKKKRICWERHESYLMTKEVEWNKV